MKEGDLVGNYHLLEDFRVVGAGLSEWTFAERDGRPYFLKRFLSPTYPDEDAPGSAATKERKRARCAAFEAHHRGIQVALAPVTRYGGNLITTLDFFRAGAKYYKVTEKIDPAGLDIADIARLKFPAKLVLLKTVAHSLKILHDLKIVHGDLKPSNVLIKRTELGHTTKLIDFDNSYLEGHPPPPDEIVGTMNYYSPELVRYIQGEDNQAQLTTASDIFALGLIYTEYLTGALPPFDPAYREPAIAVLNGAELHVESEAAPGAVVDLVNTMLRTDPVQRPSTGEVHAALMAWRPGPPATIGRPVKPPASPHRPAPASALRGRGLRLGSAPTSPAEAAPPLRDAPPAAPAGGPAALPPVVAPESEVVAPEPETRRTPSGGSRLIGKLLNKLEERKR